MVEMKAADKETQLDSVPRELAYRANDGLEVTLLWTKEDNRLAVAVLDQRRGESFVLPIVDELPLDVFYHPWAYAPARGRG